MYRRVLSSFLLFLIFTTACLPVEVTSSPPVSALPGQTETAVTELPSLDWITVYFTDPDNPAAGTFRGGPDEALAQAIRGAKMRVDVAIYHLNLWSIRDALVEAHRKGVQVRVVVESDNMDEVEVQDLIDAGIPVLGDRRESLMHDKFVVIDNAEVWTGSMNFTTNGAYYNDNNLVRIRSSRLAENFTAEFEEMFEGDHFGEDIGGETPHPVLTINGVQVETYFSPDDNVANRLTALVNQAQDEVLFMAFSFTSDPLSEALIGLVNRGVRVAGVMEESQYYSNIGSEYDRFRNAGIDVRLDGNERNMHHKVMIIDESIVVTGSYNFSRSAEERNDENVLIIYNTQLAQQFLNEFDRVYNKAQP